MAEFCKKHCKEILGITESDSSWNEWCCEGKDYPCEQCGYEHLEVKK